MIIEAMTGSRPWLTAGWTMLHFLWVGGALGLAAAVGRRALRGAVPEVRYGFALLILGLLAVAPAAIALGLYGASDPRSAAVIPWARDVAPLPRPTRTMPATEALVIPRESAASLRDIPDGIPGRSATGVWLEAVVAGLPWLWIAGTPLMFVLLATGSVGAERLRRRSRPLPDGELTAMARRLADALGIIRPVAMGVCDHLAAPILLGVVRPLILLPAAAVTGWGPEPLEMALLHELAHVRRFDNLVNLAQRVIESLLFFHPAVWWVSGWVRLEREHCCDRMVVARTGRARPYAELLAELAVHGNPAGRAAVAMAESSIVARIRCILNPEDHLMPMSRPVAVLTAALLVVPAVLIAASMAGAPGPDAGHTAKPGTSQKPARPPGDARVEELLRRTRHGAEMFLGVQERAFALTQVAGVQARTGDREAARDTFRQAEQLAETVSFDDATYSPHILLWIAQAEQRHGFHDEAVAAARRLLRLAEVPSRNEFKKVDLHINLIATQRELGDRDGVQESLQAARRFFTTSKDPVIVASAPGLIVSSKDPVIVASAPGLIVSMQAASGDLAGALRMVRDPELFRGPSPEVAANRRHQALFGVVQAIKTDNREGAGPLLEEALRAVADYKDPLPWLEMATKNQDLAQIALAQARLGRFDEALKSARRIDVATRPGHLTEDRVADFLDQQRFHKVGTLAGIAREQVKAGDRAGVRRTAEEAARVGGAIQDDRQKYPIWQTAEVLAMAGDAAAALRLADTLNLDLRIPAYESVAATQRHAGDVAGARTTLQAAVDLVRHRLDDAKVGKLDPQSSEGKPINRLLESLGRLQAKLGDRKSAIETVRRINDGTQLEALKRLATDLATAGDLDGALETVGEMNSPKAEAEALEMVALAFSRHEAVPAAH